MNLNKLKTQKRLTESELMEFIGAKGIYDTDKTGKLFVEIHDVREGFFGRREVQINPTGRPELWKDISNVKFDE